MWVFRRYVPNSLQLRRLQPTNLFDALSNSLFFFSFPPTDLEFPAREDEYAIERLSDWTVAGSCAAVVDIRRACVTLPRSASANSYGAAESSASSVDTLARSTYAIKSPTLKRRTLDIYIFSSFSSFSLITISATNRCFFSLVSLSKSRSRASWIADKSLRRASLNVTEERKR